MIKPLDLYLYNTITKQKDKFTPKDQQNVTMYVCGPTVYDRPHIGNIRSAVVYDVLYRVLSFIYPIVTYVRNITDIDDKIINIVKNSGGPIKALTEQMIKFYEEDTFEVQCLQPTISPRATTHLNEMFEMINDLIVLGHAYIVEGHVIFNIESYSEYGALSRRSVDEMIAGARVEVAPFKKHPGDFILWKPVTEDEYQYGFDSPWGRGRPGWHIECSAMSTKHLGKDFDIHGGGVDLVFPHHENEIAQAVCANKGSGFAKTWVHNGFLTVNGEKMSKSLNNFILLRDLIDRGISGPVIRYFYLMTHYRKPIDFNDNAIHTANKALNKLGSMIEPLVKEYNYDLEACDMAVTDMLKSDECAKIYDTVEILCNDINTPNFLTRLLAPQPFKNVAMLCHLIGFKPSVLYSHLQCEIPSYILELADKRESLKALKDWSAADDIRNEIVSKGFEIMDQKGGGFKINKII
jgi:cysteinyl-tRNA synthetase